MCELQSISNTGAKRDPKVTEPQQHSTVKWVLGVPKASDYLTKLQNVLVTTKLNIHRSQIVECLLRMGV